MPADPALLQALRNLHNQSDFRLLRGYLQQLVDVEMRRAIAAPENADVMRGRAQLALEIRDLIETAPDRASRQEIRK